MRRDGMDALQQIGNTPEVQWVVPKEVRSNQVRRKSYSYYY